MFAELLLYAAVTLVPGYAHVWTDGVNTWGNNPFCAEAGALLQPESPAIDAGDKNCKRVDTFTLECQTDENDQPPNSVVTIPTYHCPLPGSALDQPRLPDGHDSYCVEWSGSAPDIGACEYWATIQPNTVAMIVRQGLIVGVSRRSTDTTSVISILVNQNEVIGPQGVEVVYPAGYTLSVSRRASNTTSVVSILVNKSMVVTVNGIQSSAGNLIDLTVSGFYELGFGLSVQSFQRVNHLILGGYNCGVVS